MKKLKIVNYSDIHEKWDVVSKLPEGDILLFAGDHSACNPKDYDRQFENLGIHLSMLLADSHKWDHIVIAFGNHDPAFDYSKYETQKEKVEIYNLCWEAEKDFNKQSKRARIYITPGMSIHRIISDDYELRILSSPYSKPFGIEEWGFWWTQENIDRYMTEEYHKIFNNIDIVVSHESALYYGDKVTNGENAGTTTLLDILKHHGSKPKLFVSGHIHEGYGTYEGQDDWKGTTFVNASVLNRMYKQTNEPIVFEMEIENGKKI